MTIVKTSEINQTSQETMQPSDRDSLPPSPLIIPPSLFSISSLEKIPHLALASDTGEVFATSFVNPDDSLPMHNLAEALLSFRGILKQLLRALPDEGSPLFKETLSQIKNDIDKQVIALKNDLIPKLKALYKLRWQEIKDTEKDYTRASEMENKPWVDLATYLAKKKLIHANYYVLLIPSLCQHIDPVTYRPITDIPLADYILSDDETYLIALLHCENHYKAQGSFCNCSHYNEARLPEQAQPLTEKEVQRVFKTARYQNMKDQLACLDDLRPEKAKSANKVPSKTLSKASIQALRNLVNEAIFTSGLVYAGSYSAEEQKKADEAFLSFYIYYLGLSEEEQHNLNEQHITSYIPWKTNGESTGLKTEGTLGGVLKQIQNEEFKGCVAAAGFLYLAKIVIDYEPDTPFSSELENYYDLRMQDITRLSLYRKHSAKKVYSDYDWLDANEAKRRLLIIFASLLTYKFSSIRADLGFFLLNAAASFAGNKNYLTNTTYKIFQKIEPFISNEEEHNGRFIYSSIIEHIVRPALNDPAYLRRPGTKDWLTSLVDETLFMSDNAQFFEPLLLIENIANQKILACLHMGNHEPAVYPAKTELKTLSTTLTNILKTEPSPTRQWLKCNIAFTKFMQFIQLSYKLIPSYAKGILPMLRLEIQLPLDPVSAPSISPLMNTSSSSANDNAGGSVEEMSLDKKEEELRPASSL